jgi:hypothetical protein
MGKQARIRRERRKEPGAFLWPAKAPVKPVSIREELRKASELASRMRAIIRAGGK